MNAADLKSQPFRNLFPKVRRITNLQHDTLHPRSSTSGRYVPKIRPGDVNRKFWDR